MPAEKCLGKVDPNTVKEVVKEITVEEKELEKKKSEIPPLDQCLNLYDFEVSIFPKSRRWVG